MNDRAEAWPWRPADEVRTGPGWYQLARLVKVALGFLVLVYALDIAGSWWSAHVLGAWIDDPTSIQLSQAQRLDTLDQASSVVEALLGLVAGVLFISWLFQAQRRPLPSPSALTLRRGWAIGAWFVPFANFVLPYRVVANLDRATSRYTTKADRLIGWWWGAYVVFVLFQMTRAAASEDSGTSPMDALQAVHSREVTDVELSVVAVVAAVLAMVVVHRITGRISSSALPEPVAAVG